MPNSDNLFSVSSAACCREYRNVRDAKTERLEEIRKHCEDLWREFQDYADGHFVSEFSRHFHQRWFEMYLAVSLLRRGIQIQSHGDGPDILLDLGDRRIWIEAVCATAGEAGLPDSVPQTPLGKVARVPIREYVLRIRTSLHDKARKFQTYIDKGTVCAHDTLTIAINTYGIDGIIPDIEDIMMRALYGRGDRILTFDKYTKELKSVGHNTITEVTKKSGSAVRTVPFLDGSMAHISSALVFWGNAANRPTRLGGDCALYPNLSCRYVWSQGVIPMGREWTFSECEDGWKGSPIDYLND